MPARSATQKLVDACLRAPPPVAEIAAPPREVTAAAKFTQLDVQLEEETVDLL